MNVLEAPVLRNIFILFIKLLTLEDKY